MSEDDLTPDELFDSYSLSAFLADRKAEIIIFLVGMVLVFGMACVLGVGSSGAVFLAFVMGAVGIVILLVEYFRRRSFWRSAQDAVLASSKPNEIVSLVSQPTFLESRIAFQVFECIERLSNSETSRLSEEAQDYRRYIELWIHETKTPIAAAKLVSSRIGGQDGAAVSLELERLDRQVEQALYYARSTSVAEDYSIRETNLLAVCTEACKRNARLLIECDVTPRFDIPDDLTVLSDKPWLLFMLGQVIANAAQYKSHTIKFSAQTLDVETPRERTKLEVRDDGEGVNEADISHVFEKGFTGKNGRVRGNATGMGLYLIAIMCQSLGIGVSFSSEYGNGSCVSFTFPHDRRRMRFASGGQNGHEGQVIQVGQDVHENQEGR